MTKGNDGGSMQLYRGYIERKKSPYDDKITNEK